MNLKEVSELRRRFRMDRNAISRIYGCFVNSSREIVSYIDESMGILPQDEAEKYLNLLKKALSGKLGKNLIDIIFSTEQVADSDEHRLLMALRDSELKDGEIREEFYQKIINSLDLGDSNYLILLAYDTYDVPRKNKTMRWMQMHPMPYSPMYVCCVCPVKERKVELGFSLEIMSSTVVPARSLPHRNWDSCSQPLTIVRPISTTLCSIPERQMRSTRKLSTAYFIPQPPCLPLSKKKHSRMHSAKLWVMPAIWNWSSLSMTDSATRLNSIRRAMTPNRWNSPSVMRQQSCAITVWKRRRSLTFRDSCATQFGDGATLNPANLIDSSRFEVKTADATISVGPEHSYLVETRIIDGRKYLLIPADEDIEVNGFGVRVKGE